MSKIVNKEEKVSTNINQTYIGYYNDLSGAYMLRINDYAQIPFDGTVTIKRRDVRKRNLDQLLCCNWL